MGKEIRDYNQLNISPPWDGERLKREVQRIWARHYKEHGEPTSNTTQKSNTFPKAYLASTIKNDTTPKPKELMGMGLLPPKGVLVLGGAPKVGKSDFLMTLLAHMAAGKSFMGFAPPRPLSIYMLQCENGYFYLRERLNSIVLNFADDAWGERFALTDQCTVRLTDELIDHIAKQAAELLKEKADIIVIDPLRNVYFTDNARENAENDNGAMSNFLTSKVLKLRDKINPDAGVILVHHLNKALKKQVEEDAFNCFAGAGSLRAFYSTGIVMHKAEAESNNVSLHFELRNGAGIKTKTIHKHNGEWIEDTQKKEPLVTYNLTAEPQQYEPPLEQKIIQLLKDCAAKGQLFYSKYELAKYTADVLRVNEKTIRRHTASLMECGVILSGTDQIKAPKNEKILWTPFMQYQNPINETITIMKKQKA